MLDGSKEEKHQKNVTTKVNLYLEFVSMWE